MGKDLSMVFPAAVMSWSLLDYVVSHFTPSASQGRALARRIFVVLAPLAMLPAVLCALSVGSLGGLNRESSSLFLATLGSGVALGSGLVILTGGLVTFTGQRGLARARERSQPSDPR